MSSRGERERNESAGRAGNGGEKASEVPLLSRKKENKSFVESPRRNFIKKIPLSRSLESNRLAPHVPFPPSAAPSLAFVSSFLVSAMSQPPPGASERDKERKKEGERACRRHIICRTLSEVAPSPLPLLLNLDLLQRLSPPQKKQATLPPPAQPTPPEATREATTPNSPREAPLRTTSRRRDTERSSQGCPRNTRCSPLLLTAPLRPDRWRRLRSSRVRAAGA